MPIFTYIPNKFIDKQRWDFRIASASNGLVYAYSWFLDFMSPGWDALITEDYQFVMPLTWKKKYGIRYLCQPSFTGQLGVFGNDITPDIVTAALKAVPPFFRLIEISLNEGNNEVQMNGIHKSSNYLLNLHVPWENIRKKFRYSTRQCVQHSIRAGNIVTSEIPIEEVLKLMLRKMSAISNLRERDAHRFQQLFLYAAPLGYARTYGVYDRNGLLLSSAVLLYSHKRIYYVMAGNHPDGRKSNSSHLLLSGILQKYADTHNVFDFEGSDLPGIAAFFQGFGAFRVGYPRLQINRLPRIVNFVRKLI